MLKRRSAWFGGGVSLLLVLSMSGIVAAADDLTPPDAVPTVNTTASFEDVDGNGIDDDCQQVAAVADPAAAAAAETAVDTNADGVISTSEAAHSARIGGKNCNQGGYVSWIAHQGKTCAVTPTEPVVTPVAATLVVSEPNGDEPEATEPDADACDEATESDSASADRVDAAAARAAAKAEKALAKQIAKAEKALARQTAKADKAAARDARKAAHAAKHKTHKSH